MKKIFSLILLLFGLFFLFPEKANAFKVEGPCQWELLDRNWDTGPPFAKDPDPDINQNYQYHWSMIDWRIKNLNKQIKYTVKASCTTLNPCWNSYSGKPDPSTGVLEKIFNFNSLHTRDNIKLEVYGEDFAVNPGCVYTIEPGDWYEEALTPTPTPVNRAECSLNLTPWFGINENDPLTVLGKITGLAGLDKNTTKIFSFGVGLTPVRVTGMGYDESFPYTSVDNNTLTFRSDIKQWPPGIYDANAEILLYYGKGLEANAKCSIKFDVCKTGDNSCAVTILSPTPAGGGTPVPVQIGRASCRERV